MNLNLSVRKKIQLYILGSTVLIYVAVFGYISLANRKLSFSQTTKMIDAYSERYAREVGIIMNSDMSMLRTISEGLKAAKGYSPQQLMALKNEMIRNIFKVNPNIYSIWDSWEYSFLDPSWSKPYGRNAFTIINENGKISENVTDRSLDGDPPLYAVQKNYPRENAWEPYMDVYSEGKSEAKMMSTLSVPMMRDGKFIGLMAEDVTLDQFQAMLEKIKPFEGTNAMLVSQTGSIAGHPNKTILAKNISNIKGVEEHATAILDSVKAGLSCSFVAKDSLGVETYFSFAPIKVGRDNASTWALGISVPTGEIYAQNRGEFFITLLVGLLGLAFLSIVISILSKSITDPVKRITGMLDRMSRGELSADMHVQELTNDELGEMGDAINKTLDGLLHKERFAAQIGMGQLDAELELMSKDDLLGKSLVDMRNGLKKAKEDDELRKQHDERLRWSADSLASINEIIRKNNHDIDLLCSSLVREVVVAIDANQGGIFLLNDKDESDPIYEMKAAFAYNRQKLLKKSFKVGEGLLGTCVAEKEQIYLKELPNDYIEITSGLGGANPNNLFIVPFIHDGKVLGVIELASFKLIEDYQQELILKVAESVASAISSTQTNTITQELLEQSKMQAEMMAAQEEEMRQNMEELRSTQEEAQRQSDLIGGMIQAFGKSVMWTEYDPQGVVIGASESLLAHLNVTPEKIFGTQLEQELANGGYSHDDFARLWNSVKAGSPKRVVVERKVGGETRKFEESFTPVYEGSTVAKVLKVSHDITAYCMA
jgi:methyl-accepting chemotaxis protein/PAS domain-containing protein